MNTKTLRACARAAIVMASAFASFGAFADHKLFPTDALGYGEADVQLGYAQEKIDGAVVVDGTRYTGDLTSHEPTLAARFGVGAQTHLGISYQPIAYKLRADVGGSTSYDTAVYSLYLRHAVSMEGPVSLSFDAGIANEKTDGARSSNVVNLGVNAGMKLSSGVRPYASLSVALPDAEDSIVRWKLEGGAWIPLHQRLTLIPFAKLVYADSANGRKGSTGYGLGVSAVAQLLPNTYVKPELSFTSSKIDDEDVDATRLGVTLYHKF